jgi:hypothetical protein
MGDQEEKDRSGETDFFNKPRMTFTLLSPPPVSGTTAGATKRSVIGIHDSNWDAVRVER